MIKLFLILIYYCLFQEKNSPFRLFRATRKSGASFRASSSYKPERKNVAGIAGSRGRYAFDGIDIEPGEHDFLVTTFLAGFIKASDRFIGHHGQA